MKGGSAGTGKAKARSSEKARKAARARWDKIKDSEKVSSSGDLKPFESATEAPEGAE